MKKVILALAVASVFAACNNGGSDKPANDSTKTVVPDSTKKVVDTAIKAVVDTAKKMAADTAKKTK